MSATDSSLEDVATPLPAREGHGDGVKPALRVLSIVEDTTVDGPGFRTAIYCAGCTHHCPGCHNPQSWAKDGGTEMAVEDIMQIIEADPFAHVTFSGGDPMQQAEGFTALAQAIKTRTHKTIWCYTGYTFERLLDMPAQRQLLNYIDVLVDGPFVNKLQDSELLFRGSTNQRLIDVPRSLTYGQVVEWRRS